MTTKRLHAEQMSDARVRVAVTRVLNGVPSEVKSSFLHAVAPDEAVASQPSGDVPDPALWGRAPRDEAVGAAGLGVLERAFAVRTKVLAASLTRRQAADLLSVSDQAVTDKIASGDLIAVKQGREWRLPAWQFDADAGQGFLPGLSRLHHAFPGGVVSLTIWATSSNVELGGRAPADLLAEGEVDRVLAVVAGANAAAW